MMMRLKHFSICLLAIVTLMVVSNNSVYAIDKGTKSDYVNKTGSHWGAWEAIDSNTAYGVNATNLLTGLKTDHCNKFKKLAEAKYVNPQIIGKLDYSGAVSGSEYLTSGDSSFLDAGSTSEVKISIATSDNTTYTFTTFTSRLPNHTCVIDGEEVEHNGISKNSIPSDCSYYADKDIYKKQYDSYTGAVNLIKKIQENTIMGLVAGSVGSGFNVGTVYSQQQQSLSSITSFEGDGYDFSSMGSVKTSFDYYISPIFGKLSLTEEPKLPTTPEGWVGLLNTVPDAIVEGTVNINETFLKFREGLAEDKINDKGLKITNSVTFPNGAKAVSGVTGSEKPKSVLSYNMKVAVPYIFRKYNNNYKLDANNLRILDDVYFCIYNNNVVDSKFNSLANLQTLELSRAQVYLYYQVVDGYKQGVVLIGQFHEVVADINNSMLYATGRKIGFSNGYSDLLTLNKANTNLMYSVGSVSNSGKNGFLPKNVAFLVGEEEAKLLKENGSTNPEAVANGTTTFNRVTLSKADAQLFINTSANHTSINENPDYFKVIIEFGKVKKTSAKATDTEASGIEVADTEETSTPIEGVEETEDDGSLAAFMLYRNNRYINDADLISWLSTSEAHSIPYVDADALLSKIRGDFTESMDTLDYDDWLKMQDIKEELQHNKDMLLVRVINVLSIILGVSLICFSILLVLAYWIDIFNTLTTFSFLFIISRGNLYPISSKDTIPYIQKSTGATKFVDFWGLLLIAGICCGVGILFLQVEDVIRVILWLYNYLMTTLGGR